MKKLIPIIFILMCVISNKNKENETIIIPIDAIRFRIVANSNTLEDQQIKLQVKKEIEPIINNIMKHAKSNKEAQNLIKQDLSTIRNTVNKITLNNQVNFGINYFPEKVYQGITYKEGEYESLVINLGESKGNNWWCVMFPPLCLVDEENMNKENTEYRFLIKDILTKYES